MEKLKGYLFFAGVDRSTLDRIIPHMQRANRAMAGTLSAIATLLIGVMFLLSHFVQSIMQNKTVYGVGMALSATILLFSKIAKKHEWLITPLVYAVWSVYYLYGIFLGAVTDPHGKTVTFIVMLVYMPILFVNRPLHIVTVSMIYDTIFIALCMVTKDGTVLSVDIIDAVFYGVLGITSGLVINHVKISGYLHQQQLQEVSRIDQLTQMNNRNAFELDLFSVSKTCRHSLACLYIDVNGLHELNNSRGHSFGDEMLKFVAKQIKTVFSDEFTYRIGGDEFVVFIPDMQKADVGQKAEKLSALVSENGYHIATGYEFMHIRQLSVRELIKSAEAEMYKNKAQYYEHINRTVRNETN